MPRYLFFGTAIASDSATLKNKLASKYLYDAVERREKEYRIISTFLDRLQLDRITVTHSDKPDFSISFVDGKFCIGIEVTQLYADAKGKSSPERQRHSHWKKLQRQLGFVFNVNPDLFGTSTAPFFSIVLVTCLRVLMSIGFVNK